LLAVYPYPVKLDRNTLPDISSSFLNSYSMVFFSKNHVFAVILLLVTFFDPVAGTSGLIAVCTANLVAWLIGFNRLNLLSGVYGFNSLLVGLGVGIHYQFSPELIVLLVFSSLLSLFFTLFFEGMIGKYGLPFLTFPFLLTFWLVLLAARRYTELDLSERGIFTYNEFYYWGGSALVDAYKWFNELQLPLALSTYFKSLSAIFFQYHLFPGMLIAIGLLLYSRIAFILSLLGFYSAFLFYHFIGADLNELNYSFIGFNFILTAIAIGGFFIISSRFTFLWVIFLTPIISILLSSSSELLGYFQLSTYSFPFNVVVIIFLYMLRFRENREKKLDLVGFQEYSPERNLYSQKNNKTRFRGDLFLPFSLPFMGEWTVTQGHSGEFTHKDIWRHAWDFEIRDEEGKTFTGRGANLADYYCYSKPVLATADGWVEEVVDNVDDNLPGDVNTNQNWGNTIIIRHLDGLYTKTCHLKKGSIVLDKGTFVKKGDKLALCGNSGRSPYPHIHFQVQATPYIGSATLDYPLGRYVRHYKNNYELLTWEKPELEDRISNIDKVNSLGTAFNFVPGQKISFFVEEPGKEPVVIIWQVEIDIYNYTYLHCLSSGSKAYFRNEPDQHYFTWFTGNRKSLLHDFYLGAYKVARGYYPGLLIRDEFPLYTMQHGLKRIAQDFIAPFHIFIRSEYRMEYVKMEDEIGQTRIHLASSLLETTSGRTRQLVEFSFLVDNNRVEYFKVKRKGREIKASYHTGEEI
jgi:urea transporter/murein DD-endopeptidase MepM/ murein hydrolase activator NlpD